MIKKICLSFVPLIFCLLFTALPTHAAGLDFDVRPASVTADNLGYFRFAAKPGHSYPLVIALHNLSQHPLTINVTRDNALTSTHGGIQYTLQRKLPYSQLTDKSRAMVPMLEGPNKVTLASGQSMNISYTLRLPDKLTEGVLLGGLSFCSPSTETTSTEKTKGKSLIITNQVERVIGIEAVVGNSPAANISFQKPSVTITASGPIVLPTIENASATIANINFKWAVYTNDQKLFSGQTDSFKMAPCSSIGYSIPWGAKTFGPGDYRLEITRQVAGKTVTESYPFTVMDQAVKNYQSETQTRPVAADTINWGLLIGGIIIGAVLVWLFLFFINRKKNKTQDQQVQKERKTNV
ncbi:WxL protein peptidoglycan domain-containing protein [Sporolactobacillus sp. KGMB 08714]|uniref:WxL protein peptidoglycan domain-containing protein n=1 Tax=Sporolactobacillus sp. KGMB 08714 TaxID=3064704 RepID=UPI002FBE82B7